MRAVVEVPGSKSLTNRALLLAALSDAPSTITGALRARDTVLMGRALVALGTSVDGLDDDGPVRVTPAALRGPAHVDCGLAGTVMRFVPPVAGLADGDVRFDGDPRARVRPMDVVIGSLEQLGVEVDDDGRGTLPFTVKGTGAVRGGDLVAHQRQQRRDDHRWSGPLRAAQRRGDEIDGRLPPPGALDHEHPVAAGHQGLDGLEPVLVQCGFAHFAFRSSPPMVRRNALNFIMQRYLMVRMLSSSTPMSAAMLARSFRSK